MKILFALMTLSFLARNLLLPLAADDYSYAFVWDGEHGGNILAGVPDSVERVDSLGDLIASQWSHYFTWGGRTPAHTLIQLFVWSGKFWFDLANTMMFVLLIVLIARLADVRLTLRKLFWIGLGLWLAVPEWISTMLWLTGAINYLWAGVAQLFFVSMFLERSKKMFLIPIGLLAGWSNEAGGLVAGLIAAAFVFERKKIRSVELIGLLSFAIGYALLILAPGNFNRLELSHPNFAPSAELLANNFFVLVHVVGNEIVLLIPILIRLMRRQTDSTEKIFLAAGLLVPMMMLASPEFPLRSCFMSAIFLMIASLRAFDRLGLERIDRRVLIAIGFVWALSVAGSLYSDVSIARQMNARLEYVEARRSEALIEVEPLNPTRRLEKILGLRVFGSAAMSIGGELSSDPSEGHNVTFAKYHGLRAIAVRK